MSDQVQRDRAIDPTISCCVVAPAGSGKTSLLVQRMLALLARVPHPEHIVAITFTRKAAAEMRARMAEAFALAQADEQVQVADYEKTTFSLAKQALENAKKCGWDLPQQLERLQFMTIDSFCATLVRQMPVGSRMGGSINPAEPPAELYRAAVLDLLYSSEAAIQQQLAPILAALGNRWDLAVTWLSELLAKRDQWQLALFPGQREQDALHFMRDTWAIECRRRVMQLNQDLEPWRAELQQILHLLSIEKSAEYRPLHALDSITSWRRVAEFLLTKNGEWRARVTVSEGFPPKSEQKLLWDRVIAEVKGSLSTTLFEGVQLMPESLEADEDWLIVNRTVAILPHLLASFWWQCQQRGEVDFTQVASAALEALGDDDSPTDLALKLDYGIHHLLVDEFQDTSTHQFELIRRLTRGWLEHNESRPSSPKTLFLVGDAMQSIYRFRGAQVDLFVRAIEEGFNGLRLERLDLARNFRSERGVVEWVNTVFGQTDSDPSPMLQRLTANVAEPVLDGEGGIQYHAFLEDPRGVQETQFIVRRIQDWLQENPSKTTAVLGRTRTQLAPIMRALKDAGIAYSASDVERIADNVAVTDFVNLLCLLVNPSDTLACMGCLRAPWLGMPLAMLHCAARIHANNETGDWHQSLIALESECDEESLRKCLTRFNQILAWGVNARGRRSVRAWLDTLWNALAGSSIYLNDVDQSAIQALFEVLEEHPEYVNSPWAIVEMLESKTMATDSTGSVLVMTMHKSKGLEFDRVVLPSMGRAGRSSPRQLFVWAELPVPHAYGFLLGCAKGTAGDGPSVGRWLHEREKLALSDELKRLFYVAATRAKSELCITTSYAQDEFERCKPANASLLGQVSALALQEPVWHEARDSSVLAANTLSNLQPMRLRRFVPESAPTLPGRSLESLERDLTVAQDWYESGAAVGSLVHKAFELAIKANQLPSCDSYLRDRLKQEALALGQPVKNCEGCVGLAFEAIEATVNNTEAHWLFVGDDWLRYPEYNVARASDRQVESYYIDVFLRSTVSGDLKVVDFKTNKPEFNETNFAFEERMRRTYQPQLQIYVDIIAEIEQVQPKACLFLTYTQRFLDFDFTTRTGTR